MTVVDQYKDDDDDEVDNDGDWPDWINKSLPFILDDLIHLCFIISIDFNRLKNCGKRCSQTIISWSTKQQSAKKKKNNGNLFEKSATIWATAQRNKLIIDGSVCIVCGGGGTNEGI